MGWPAAPDHRSKEAAGTALKLESKGGLPVMGWSSRLCLPWVGVSCTCSVGNYTAIFSQCAKCPTGL